MKFIQNGIVVLNEDFSSDVHWKITSSNIDVVNAMISQGVPDKNLSKYALYSYYADYYLAQVNNGGFSQFVFNSRWRPAIIDCVKNGLLEIKAEKNLELFYKSSQLLDDLGEKGMHRFLYRDYFGDDNPERDYLDKYNVEFYSLQNEECISKLNSSWLKNHEYLIPLPVEDIKTYIWLAINHCAKKT